MTQLEQQPTVAVARQSRMRRRWLPRVTLPPEPAPAGPRPWYLSTIGLALSGSLLMWAALPPLDLGLLGWVAPVCWLVLIRRHHLDGRRPYLNIFLAGLVFWLAALYWLTLPHWSATFGWIGLSIYLACYVALFIGLTRVAVHRLRVPILVSAPIVWTGLEWLRANLFTGFLMASLAHTQYRWISIIQISDLAGAYGVSFLIMFVAACTARMLPVELHRPRIWPLVPLVLAIAAAYGYGQWRMAATTTRPGPTVALIQGNVDTDFSRDPRDRNREVRQQYLDLSQKALAARPDVDLVVWPESMYWTSYMVIQPGAYLPASAFASTPDVSPQQARQWEAERRLPEPFYDHQREVLADLRRTVAVLGEAQGLANPAEAGAHDPDPVPHPNAVPDKPQKPGDRRPAGEPVEALPLGPALMLGMDTEVFTPGAIRRYSSSVFLDRHGHVADYYNKMHPVLFGEYVPLGDYFPWLYTLTPLAGGLTEGAGPKVFNVAGARVAPSICYETVMPHLIRGQVDTLRRAGIEPDVLITQTNDGWFHGSSALDMHMICSVFRAVECRKPMLIAANTGISAVIDSNGRIVDQIPRQTQDFRVVDVKLDSRGSPYVHYGDTLAIACAACCGVLMAFGLGSRLLGSGPRGGGQAAAAEAR